MYLKQSTAGQVVRLGPFLDSTDGVTPETELIIANTDIDISKAGSAFASKNSGGATAEGANGWYHTTFDATDTSAVGIMEIEVTFTGALPVFKTFYVLEEAIYDALFADGATGLLPATVSGGATEAKQVTAQADLDILTGTDGATLATTQGNYAPNKIAPDNTSIADILVDTGTTIPGTISTLQTSVDDVPTNAELTARTLPTASYFDPSADTVANVTTVATTTTNTDMRGTESAATATALATMQGNVTSILADTNELQSDDLPSLLAALDVLIDAIKAKTDNLTFTSGTDLDANIQKVNDVTVTGTGSTGNEWGP